MSRTRWELASPHFFYITLFPLKSSTSIRIPPLDRLSKGRYNFLLLTEVHPTFLVIIWQGYTITPTRDEHPYMCVFIQDIPSGQKPTGPDPHIKTMWIDGKLPTFLDKLTFSNPVPDEHHKCENRGLLKLQDTLNRIKDSSGNTHRFPPPPPIFHTINKWKLRETSN